MNVYNQRRPAGRRLLRPEHVETCPECGDAVGFNYLDCPTCHHAVERFWEADWTALLTAEQIAPGSPDELLLAQVVIAELDDHLWTVADMAMCRVRCEECGSELGGGPVSCSQCEFAFGNLWWHDIEAGRQGVMRMDEHALRVGRYVIRYPHRHSAVVAAGWRMNLPRILTGWLPDGAEARRMADQMKAQRYSGRRLPASSSMGLSWCG